MKCDSTLIRKWGDFLLALPGSKGNILYSMLYIVYGVVIMVLL